MKEDIVQILHIWYSVISAEYGLEYKGQNIYDMSCRGRYFLQLATQPQKWNILLTKSHNANTCKNNKVPSVEYMQLYVPLQVPLCPCSFNFLILKHHYLVNNSIIVNLGCILTFLAFLWEHPVSEWVFGLPGVVCKVHTGGGSVLVKEVVSRIHQMPHLYRKSPRCALQ